MMTEEVNGKPLKCRLGIHDDYDKEKHLTRKYCVQCGHKTDFSNMREFI